MIIQKRQPFKSGWSGLWDISLGGSAQAGENSQQAAERELLEELGVRHSFAGVRPAITLRAGQIIDDIYIIKKSISVSELKFQPEEVETARCATIGEILALIGNGDFIPYFESYISFVFDFAASCTNLSDIDRTVPSK